MSTTEEKPNRPTMPSVFAFGAMLGGVIMLFLFIDDTKQLKALPVTYQHCTNYPGVAAACEVRARFATKETCEDYRHRIWLNQDGVAREPDDIRTYCR